AVRLPVSVEADEKVTDWRRHDRLIEAIVLSIHVDAVLIPDALARAAATRTAQRLALCAVPVTRHRTNRLKPLGDELVTHDLGIGQSQRIHRHRISFAPARQLGLVVLEIERQKLAKTRARTETAARPGRQQVSQDGSLELVWGHDLGYRDGRRASWNQTRTSAILACWSGGAWRWQVAASGVPAAAPQRVSTQSLGL